MGIFDPTTETVSTDSGAVQEDFDQLKKNIPKVNVPSETNTPGGNIIFDPGGRSNIVRERLARQINRDLGVKGPKKAKRIKGGVNKGGAKIGGFGSSEDAIAHAEELKAAAAAKGTEAFGDVDYKVVRGKKGFQVQVVPTNRTRSTNFERPEQFDAEGNPIADPTASSTETTNLGNERVQDILNQLTPEQIEAERARAGVFTGVQDDLAREAAGVGEFSEEQEAEVQRALDFNRARGEDQLLNSFGQGVSQVRNSLQSSGFGSSNLADINLQAGPERQFRQGTVELARELGSLEQDVRSNIATRQNAGVDTLNNIDNARTPELPGTQQLQDGTFQKMPSLAEVTSLARLFNLDIPAKDQDAFMGLLQSLIGAQDTVVGPSPFSQVAGAIGGAAGAAATAYAGRR